MSTILANDRQSVRVNLDKVISYTLITPLEALQLGEFQIPNYLENYSYIEFVIEGSNKIFWEFEDEDQAIKTIKSIDKQIASMV